MAKEIERKFLVKSMDYRAEATKAENIAQGYLSYNPQAIVRVRTKGEKGYLTIKSVTIGTTRDEWEYEIPLCDAEAMLKLCADESIIRKTRYRVGRWEIDEFHGKYEGRIIAEIELDTADEKFELPSFIGEEVTGKKEYYNSVMAIS